MTGPEHYAEAERLLAVADRHTSGVTYGPVDATDWRPVRQRQRYVDADLLVVGFGFVPNVELCELAGCETGGCKRPCGLRRRSSSSSSGTHGFIWAYITRRM